MKVVKEVIIMLITRPRGTNDITPESIKRWQYLEKEILNICSQYGYEEIRTPIFENTELFARGVGETTDIVEKEMYSFNDQAKRSLTLRPEGTASTVRAFLENKIYTQPQPSKLFYMGPMFRYDRPQAGRYRQFHQFGVEVFGSNHPSVDAEVITLACDYLERLGLDDLDIHINTVGCPKCRPIHKQELLDFFEPIKEDLCKTCQGRLKKNPLRILDCKNDNCQVLAENAVTTLDSACKDCKDHFNSVVEYLDKVNLKYTVDPRLVRGLDYYTNTAFEIIYEGIGAQGTICGGGRYNGLVEQCGGKQIPGIGFAMGLERLLLTLEQEKIEIPIKNEFDIYIASLGEDAQLLAFDIAIKLRKKGYKVEKDYLEKSLKAQMKTADRFLVKYVLIIGDEEIANNCIVVRDMITGNQEKIPAEDIVSFFEGRL